ncbi:MAG: Lrp/AsnC family transcriptional regulator [Peptococcaceae bacterium]|nr:Lrp/AsnC family transcriptional regulator [Peptococcaceae bacterium]
MLSEIDKQIIREIQSRFPITERPFAVIGERVGLSEEEVFSRVQQYLKEGKLKRLGAALKHQRVGYLANAMIVWRVPEDRIDQVGEQLASFEEVTHCYHRATAPGWPFNVYCMVHKHTREECYEAARRLSEAVGIKDYFLLFSTRELKRTSMSYFHPKEKEKGDVQLG